MDRKRCIAGGPGVRHSGTRRAHAACRRLVLQGRRWSMELPRHHPAIPIGLGRPCYPCHPVAKHICQRWQMLLGAVLRGYLAIRPRGSPTSTIRASMLHHRGCVVAIEVCARGRVHRFVHGVVVGHQVGREPRLWYRRCRPDSVFPWERAFAACAVAIATAASHAAASWCCARATAMVIQAWPRLKLQTFGCVFRFTSYGQTTRP